jgi:hypothetical protein
MQINCSKETWDEGINKWDLVSYSLPQNIDSVIAKDTISVGGYFQHGSSRVRLSVLQGMLDGFPCIALNWTTMHFGLGCSLASNGKYQAFLAASTKERDVDLNPHQMMCVNVRGSTDTPPKKQGPVVGSLRPRPPLAALDSLLNSIGLEATALPGLHTLTCSAAGLHTLTCSAAKSTASGARALPALPALPAAAQTPTALAVQVGIAKPHPARPRLSRPPASTRARAAHAPARRSGAARPRHRRAFAPARAAPTRPHQHRGAVSCTLFQKCA